jgi:molybdopterin/thiamine biosynthesis adenylyltransferase
VSERRAFFRELASAALDARRATEPAPPEPEEVVLPQRDEGRLDEGEVERYSRQLVLDEWGEPAQLALRRASVLVVGAGGLGSPVATYLAAAKLRFLNPGVVVEPYRMRVDAGNAAGLVAGQDLVVDCSDAFATRYAVNAACCAAGVDLVEGGVVGLGGLVMTIRPGRSACYRCAFPEAPANAPSCAAAGVLGPAAGVVGSLQALEALKLLSGVGEPLVDAFLSLDLAGTDILRVAVRRREDCPDCGARTL